MLHFTNGEIVSEQLELTGLPGEIVAWADPLHEGPVPAGVSDARLDRVRAEFVEQCGWAAFEDAYDGFRSRRDTLTRPGHGEVVLWFEHDLLDQLQLIQVPDVLARARTHEAWCAPLAGSRACRAGGSVALVDLGRTG